MPPLAFWRIELLGGLRAVSGATVLTQFGSRRIAALLARLALEPQRVHPREELIDLLWPEVDLATGRNRLRHALSTLRRLLQPPGAGDVLLADRFGVRLNPRAVACDALEFVQHATAGRKAQARRLYRGELLPGFYDEWIEQERLRLQALHDRLVDGEQDAESEPLPNASLPSAPTVGVTLFPDRQVLLPSYLSSFVGREAELQELAARLAERRLVTVSGPGGCGKTRLAAEVARQIAGRFEVLLFVGLADVDDAAQIFETIRQALRLPPRGQDAQNQVLDLLCEREVLLVLDNFEHLAVDGPEVIRRLLAALPRVRCLVTSRRVLLVDGEHELAMLPLPVPAEVSPLPDLMASPGIALFIDRARSVRPEFQLTARNAADLVRLVSALKGLPLAVELAASRIRSMSIAEMVREIESGRGWIARGNLRGAREPRHVSLQAAIEWSWRLLAPGQRRFLSDLTTLRGGWTAEAAAAIGAVADARTQLEALAADSLLLTQTDAWGSTRFSMLEMIREFVAAQADGGEAAAARDRHRSHFLDEVRRRGRLDAARLALDQANVEQALASGLADRAFDTALDLAVALRPFADARGLRACEFFRAAVNDIAHRTSKVGCVRRRARRR